MTASPFLGSKSPYSGRVVLIPEQQAKAESGELFLVSDVTTLDFLSSKEYLISTAANPARIRLAVVNSVPATPTVSSVIASLSHTPVSVTSIVALPANTYFRGASEVPTVTVSSCVAPAPAANLIIHNYAYPNVAGSSAHEQLARAAGYYLDANKQYLFRIYNSSASTINLCTAFQWWENP